MENMPTLDFNNGMAPIVGPLPHIEPESYPVGEFIVDPLGQNEIPIYGLPVDFRRLIEVAARVYGNPKSYWTAAVFSAISAATQKSASLDDGKYINFPQFYFCEVGRPGIGKTSPIDICFGYLLKLDSKRYEDWKIKNRIFEDEKNIDKTAQKPVFESKILKDVTSEKLFVKLSQNNESITLVNDELNGWFANMGKYGSGSDIEIYLELFNNQHVTVERISRDPILLSKPFLSIFGGIQPEVLSKLMTKDNITANGMVQRFLWVFPEVSSAKKRNKENVPVPILATYEHRIEKLTQIGDKGPIVFKLAENADALYSDFTEWIAEQVNATTDDYWCAVLDKMNIHCLRFALVTAVAKFACDDSRPLIVCIEDIRYAWDCCKYFLWSAKKVQNLNDERNRNPVTKLASFALIKEMASRYPEISKNKSRFATAIGKSRPYVSTAINHKPNDSKSFEADEGSSGSDESEAIPSEIVDK